tara:strand:- start:5452 stop:5835 length:384 start_codon:yes stop_codon:yes gene_type:complete
MDMKKIILKNSDIFGVSTSTLCLIHCLLSPLLFMAPLWWWSSLNILFISVSFIAVNASVKNTSSKIMKPLLWIGFTLLTLSIINEEIGFFHIPEILNYSAAVFLASLHIYNLKYCQCKDDDCCIHKP